MLASGANDATVRLWDVCPLLLAVLMLKPLAMTQEVVLMKHTYLTYLGLHYLSLIHI